MIRVFPLGGLGEVGMNCLAIEQRGEILLVDCGVTFDDRGIGVDVIHPDFSALDAYRDRIKGVFVTHGHEDHIGALPYLLRRFLVPVWAGPYALGLIRERLFEHEVLEHATLIEAKPRTSYDVGSFKVEPIRVTHSIADATALAITTDAGMVVHSGDFKFDESPPDGERFDEERLRQLGDDGVKLLFSDSTNVDSDGTAGSEASVGEALGPLIASAKGAVVVALFASNVHRLRLLGEIAKETGRRIVPLGRSIHTHSKVAHATGYLDWPSDLVWPAERVRELPREKILGLATGSQAEARAALARLAHGEHPNMEILPGEMVVLSSRIIPGNEREVYALMGSLLRRGVDVRSRVTDRGIHVSGHAHRGEQKRMIELIRPRSFIPVHGTIHHLTRHAELARSAGVEDALVIQNGDIAELADAGVSRGGHVPSGRVHVFAGHAIPPAVLKERQSIATTGVAFVSLVLDVQGKRIHDVMVETRGILDPEASMHLVATATNDVRSSIEEAFARGDGETTLADTARSAARRSFFKALGSKPTTLVTIHRGG
jgi:ribonuclease J